MCGILGLIETGPERTNPLRLISATQALRHRGPDDWGVVAFVPVAFASDGGPRSSESRARVRASDTPYSVVLGHRRLRIIDLSDAGRQPMEDAASGAFITYNGEVYNYRELREELVARGAEFRSRTDTEVILHGYRVWGPDVTERLRGMFAFGIWDPRAGELLLARDRLGKKPLFFHQSGDRFAFASELKAFQALPGWRPRVNAAAIHDYLTFGYVPGRQTIFEDVWKVPPGHRLIWAKGTVRIEPYWSAEAQFLSRDAREPGEAELSGEIRRLLSESVEARLVGDVPLGAFLSGGIDSAAVVALMTEHLGAAVKTFSIGFRESSFNELEHARAVARHFNTDHHEYVVEARAAELLPDLAWSMDEPFADASALPTFLLARLARKHVTVVLTGDGGDECFAGYDSYRAERWMDAYLRLPAMLRRPVEALLRLAPEGSARTAVWRRAKRFVEKAGLPFERREWRMIFPDALKRSMYRPEFASTVDGADSLERRAEAFGAWTGAGLDRVAGLQLWDLLVYLPDDLMVKTDRATMAHGLEARCPLLDHVLLERCARLPSALKLRGATTKYILRRALTGVLPPSIVARPKQGFAVPVSHWFRTELRDMARDVLLSAASRARGQFRPEAVGSLLESHEAGRADHGHKLWALINLELWHRRFTDGPQPSSSTLLHTAGER